MRRSRASEARMVGESFELSIASCAQCRRLTCGKTTHHRKPRCPACCSTVVMGTLFTALSVPLTALSVPLHREPRRPACLSTVLSREHRSTRCSSLRHAAACPVVERTACVACLSSVRAQRTANRRVPFLSDSAASPTAPFARGGFRCKAQPNPNPLLRWGGCSIGDLDIACSGDAATLFRSAERVCCGVVALPRRATSYRSGCRVAW